jgi:DNA-binding NarL/FixJ family response regulator
MPEIDITEPEPSVLVIAAPAPLRRRIVAALDFDRLPVTATGEDVDDVVGAPTARRAAVIVAAGADGDALIGLLGELRRKLPEARIVLVFERMWRGQMRRALRAGATAAVTIGQIEIGLALAVRAVALGLVVVPGGTRERLLDAERDSATQG